MKLEGKVAIVSGAGGMGNGQAIARNLAEEGTDVVAIDIKEEAARETANEIKALGRKALAIKADVTDRKQTTRLVQETLDTFGKIDILVNVVGGSGKFSVEWDKPSFRFIDITDEEWDVMLTFNLKTQFLMCQAVVPHLIKQRSGKIINLSAGGRSPSIGRRWVYGIAKAGVNQLTRSLALELAEYNINVNCVVPGAVHTPIMEEVAARDIQVLPAAKGMSIEEFFEKFRRARIPMQREPTSEDIAHAVVFLASEDAKNITGQPLHVNGGSFML